MIFNSNFIFLQLAADFALESSDFMIPVILSQGLQYQIQQSSPTTLSWILPHA